MATTMLKWITIGLIATPAIAQEGQVVKHKDGYQIEVSEVSEEESVEERAHTIKVGDTLWDISETFWGDAEQWPRMWSYNRYITNPHWIYPGNTIRFTPGTELSPPTMELDGDKEEQGTSVTSLTFEESDPVCGPDVRFNKNRESTTYFTPAFLANKDEIPVYGSVYGAKSGMKNLSVGEVIYLDVNKDWVVECGDVFTVFRRRPGKVRHPDSWFRKYGFLHEVVGEIRVTHVGDEMATAVIRRSFKHMKRGDEFGEHYPVAAELPVSVPNGELDAVILARLGSETQMLAGPGSVIFIDRGRADGLEVGDAFYVIHRSDDYRALGGYDPNIPEQVSGRIIVTELGEYHATAVIVDAARPIKIGDNLAMRVE